MLQRRLAATYTCAFAFIAVSLPTVMIVPMSLAVNLTGNVTFLCMTIGYEITSYMWMIRSGSFPNKVTDISSSTLVIPNVRSSDNNTYTCVASNIGGSGNRTAQLTVIGKTMMIV